MFAFERATGPGRNGKNEPGKAGLVSLLGLILVPLVIAGGFLWATWNSDSRLDRVQAAVVNLDQAVTIDGQIVPLGRQLAGGLVASSEQANFSWILSDPTDAAAGLASGRYGAVVTIPKSFSASATSFSSNDAAAAEPATLAVQTSEISGLADPVIGRAIAAAATEALNTQLTEQYLQNIYVGFNTLGRQFSTIAGAADQLADGTTKLSTGLDASAQGGRDFATGLTALDSGAQQLATGVADFSAGSSEFAGGMQELADGTAALPEQTRGLADGVGGVSDGAATLAAGAAKLDDSMQAFTDGTQRSADGAAGYAAGMSRFDDGLTRYAAAVTRYQQGLQQYHGAMQALQRDAIPCPERIADSACPAFQAGVRAAATGAVQGLEGTGDQPGLIVGAQQLSSAADRLGANATKLRGAADQLSAGATRLDHGATQIAAGVDGLARGAGGLSAGLDELHDGADQLATGTVALSTGIADAAKGADGLASGAGQLSTAAGQLANGTATSATGASQLSGGLGQLADGAGKLADGATKLSDGLQEGKDQVPSYDATERTKLSSVVTTPISNEQPTTLLSDVASTTFLAVVALWIGALAGFIVLRAVTARVLTSMKPSWRIAAEGWFPVLIAVSIQAFALTVLLQVLLDLSAARVAVLLPFGLLTALTFVAVNHALVAWCGGVGRFVSVTMVVLTAASGISSAIPPALDQVRSMLPLAPALDGMRAVITGADGAGAATGMLLAWLLVAAAASVLAVARRRMLAPSPVLAPGAA